MQSICTLLPATLADRVVEARALMAEEPSIGAIYDPPFAHFTLQLAEDYEWNGLADALAEFSVRETPFEAGTLGLWVGGNGEQTDVAIIPYASEQMRDFQERLWDVVMPYAKGSVRKFDYPETWFPHVTIKRCGTDKNALGRAIARVAGQDFRWTFTVDNIAVQHDPGQNSKTHYLRLHFPFGGGAQATPPEDTNGSIEEIKESLGSDGETIWTTSVSLDDGGSLQLSIEGPEMVRLMASARCSVVHFTGGRCRVDKGRITAVAPLTPFPIVG